MNLSLEPPHRVGPFEIGMPFGATQQALKNFTGFVHLGRVPGGQANPSFGHYSSGLSIAIESDYQGRLLAVELYRPHRDIEVRFGSISLFGLEANDVVEQLRGHTTVNLEEGGHGAVAPHLLLALWRGVVPESPDDEDGRYWESVLMAAPGYYDGPAAPGQ